MAFATEFCFVAICCGADVSVRVSERQYGCSVIPSLQSHQTPNSGYARRSHDATTMVAAATYFVLGKADDEDFAKAEHLAETLMSALPSGDQLHHPSH